MNIEQQVCSPEYSKRLCELGAKQDSYFYWLSLYDNQYKLYHAENNNLQDDEISNTVWLSLARKESKAWSAFTIAELGDILSKGEGFFDSGFLNCGYQNWNCRYFESANPNGNVHHCFEKTEADARAKMLICLLENKLMDLPK